MGGSGWSAFLVLSMILDVGVVESSVTYDHKALMMNGEWRNLISRSIHYPRSTAEVLQMWPDLIRKAKDGGMDVIQTYVFWNMHEPSSGNARPLFDPDGHSSNVKVVSSDPLSMDCYGKPVSIIMCWQAIEIFPQLTSEMVITLSHLLAM